MLIFLVSFIYFHPFAQNSKKKNAERQKFTANKRLIKKNNIILLFKFKKEIDFLLDAMQLILCGFRRLILIKFILINIKYLLLLLLLRNYFIINKY